MKLLMTYRKALPWLVALVLGSSVTVSCIDVGHDAELGCLADSTEPGCGTGGARATGGRSSSSSGGKSNADGGAASAAGSAGLGGLGGAGGLGGLGGFGGGSAP